MGSTLKKKVEGYGYKYTDLSGIHEWLEENGLTYYQYIETDSNGNDYIYTVPVKDGKPQDPRRGCRVVMATFKGKSNPAQEQGSAITYARRYSLLMAFGLATEDDDAACLTESTIPGYPNRSEMLTLVKKKYPEGSDNYKQLIEAMEKSSIDEFTDAQLSQVYNHLQRGK